MNWNVLNTWLELQGFENLLYRQALEILMILLITAIAGAIVGRIFTEIEKQFSKTKNLYKIKTLLFDEIHVFSRF